MTVVNFSGKREFAHKNEGAKIWRVASLHSDTIIITHVAAVTIAEAIANWSENALLGGEPYLNGDEPDCPLPPAWVSREVCAPVIPMDETEIGIGFPPITITMDEANKMLRLGSQYNGYIATFALRDKTWQRIHLGEFVRIESESIPQEVMRRHRLALTGIPEHERQYYMGEF
jgi:hypothetical protein